MQDQAPLPWIHPPLAPLKHPRARLASDAEARREAQNETLVFTKIEWRW